VRTADRVQHPPPLATHSKTPLIPAKADFQAEVGDPARVTAMRASWVTSRHERSERLEMLPGKRQTLP